MYKHDTTEECIHKLQVVQNTVLETATGCNKTHTFTICMTKHTYFPYTRRSLAQHRTNKVISLSLSFIVIVIARVMGVGKQQHQQRFQRERGAGLFNGRNREFKSDLFRMVQFKLDSC